MTRVSPENGTQLEGTERLGVLPGMLPESGGLIQSWSRSRLNTTFPMTLTTNTYNGTHNGWQGSSDRHVAFEEMWYNNWASPKKEKIGALKQLDELGYLILNEQATFLTQVQQNPRGVTKHPCCHRPLGITNELTPWLYLLTQIEQHFYILCSNWLKNTNKVTNSARLYVKPELWFNKCSSFRSILDDFVLPGITDRTFNCAQGMRTPPPPLWPGQQLTNLFFLPQIWCGN